MIYLVHRSLSWRGQLETTSGPEQPTSHAPSSGRLAHARLGVIASIMSVNIFNEEAFAGLLAVSFLC
jgi:hypothetical protein